MILAQIINNDIVLSDHRQLFPGMISDAGLTPEFLAATNCMMVMGLRDYDYTTEKLSTCEPYVENGRVYTVEVIPLTDAEKAALKVTTGTGA